MNLTSRQIYSRDAKRHYTPLAKEEENTLFKQYHEGSKEAYHRIYTSTLNLVISIAQRYANQGIEISDLIQAGNMAIARAIQDFDVTRGFRFITYAIVWIRQAILEEIASQSRFVKITGTEGTLKHKVNKAIAKLEQTLLRKPTREELSTETTINIDHIEHMELLDPQPSLNAPINEDGHTLVDIIPAKETTDIDKSIHGKVLDFIAQADLGKNKPLKTTILKMYFGLDYPISYTLDEISEEINLTRERVRQIRNECIMRLKKFNSTQKRNRQFHLEPNMMDE
jgi:RNA polymerase primary sigma factor